MTIPEKNLPPGVYRFTVAAEFAGMRLDQYLAESHEGLSRGFARRLIEIGGVHQAGRRVRRCSQQVSAGDRIEIYLDGGPVAAMRLDETRILFRDQDLIVLDKPSGMATQPTPARYQGTVYAELQRLLQNPQRLGQRPSIGMVQRLDRDTSGVMVFSIHQRAHKKMTEAFRDRDIDKRYWALVAGRPQAETGRFASQLARRRSTNLVVSVERGGKPAETRYRVLRDLAGASLVDVHLLTGRSHQIRAHFSEAGMPLLGDAAYGGPESIAGRAIPRLMLHSRELTFSHPVSGRRLTFSAPLPEDFSALLQSLADGLNGPDE
jgi:23S rRNA pseudouridine1911/1915/1917 synthase